jgi:thiamine-phosphate pyrophosphorylase
VLPADRSARLAEARLYFICEARPRGEALGPVLAAALRGGADVFQLREKNLPDQDILEAAAVARELCEAAGALFVVNDRPDIALAVDADGVHVGQDDMGVEAARAIVGPDRLVGLSTHSPAQIDRAQAADMIGVGPVYATPTKRWRPAVGTELVAYARDHARQPFFAIGGIDETRAADVVAAGAARIAAVRAIAAAADPEGAARRLRATVEELALPEVAHGPA